MNAYESKRWQELHAIYSECLRIAEDIWDERVNAAVLAQRQLAETMRDRAFETAQITHRVKGDPEVVSLTGEIHVPLFTPRDRLQFVKEVAVSLLISADRRSLTITPSDADATIPFGPNKGKALKDMDKEDLRGALEWAETKGRGKYPGFVSDALAELEKRAKDGLAHVKELTEQPMSEPPMALANNTDEVFPA